MELRCKCARDLARTLTNRIAPIWWLLGASLIWRVALAAILPIGTDEAYEITVGRDFALSFFDHPPLGFWAPAIAEVLGANNPLGYRVPTLIFGTLLTAMLYFVGKELNGTRTGLWAAGLGALAPFTMLSGVLILPDGPLYPAMLTAVYALLRLERGGSQTWWWLTGFSLGIAMASKYQAALFCIGALVWVISTPRLWAWFKAPGYYAALLLAIGGAIPILWWNISNDWISMSFHTGRVGVTFNAPNLASMLLGQSLYLLPPVLVWSFIRLFSPTTWGNPRNRLLVLTGLPTVVMFNAIYVVSEDSLPHWTMPGWLLLLPLVAQRFSEKQHSWKWLAGFAAPTQSIVLIAALHLNMGLLTRLQSDVPAWDNTVPNVPLKASREVLLESGLLQGRPLVAAESWIEGGHLGAILGPSQAIRILDENPHHFLFLDGQTMTGPTALIGIARLGADADELEQRLITRALEIDANASTLGTVAVNRGNKPYFALIVVGLNF